MGTNKDYLALDSKSMERVITGKLSENTAFTDQLFEGSNLSILVEGFSYMYSILQYYLNHGASESLFEDSTIFENINRITKMIGFNPQGHINPNIEGFFKNASDTTGRISSSIINFPKYVSINTGLNDQRGLPIYYSLTKNEAPKVTPPDVDIDEESRITLTNGRWTIYNRTFTSAGLPFETFILDDLVIDSDNKDDIKYVSHPYIDVFIKRGDEYFEFQTVNEGTLIGALDTSTTTTDENRVEVRINENSKYTLKFGDGLKGTRLLNGDEVIVVYLDGNGPGSEIASNILNSDNGTVEFSIVGASDELYHILTNSDTSIDYSATIDPETLQFGITDSNIIELRNLTSDSFIFFNNTGSSTPYVAQETVEEIKENAPNWFRHGDKLTTTESYRNFMLREYKGVLYDVSIMNNFSYMTEFMYWLSTIRDCTGGNRLKPEVRDYPITDACDHNNVYIWTRFKGTAPVSKSRINAVLQPRKGLTTEPIILNALDSYFIPCLSGAFGELVDGEHSCVIGENGYSHLASENNVIVGWDPNVENYIEIEKDPNSIVTNERIKEHVIRVFLDYFKPENHVIGGTIDVRKLYDDMRSVPGVHNIRTVYEPLVGERKTIEGLSFATWTQNLANGEDKFLFNGNIKLKNFQFPRLVPLNILKLSDRFKVKFRSNNTPTPEY